MAIWQKDVNLDLLNQQYITWLGRTLGLEMTGFGDDFLEARMPVTEKVLQPFGLLNGGVSCLVAEIVASVASNMCAPDGFNAVGQQLNASHLRPVFKGDTITARATNIHAGKRSQLWDVTIHDSKQKLVCKIMFTTALVPAS